MNRITAGLYVAFDKTAIALALTMAAMFMQFAVQRIELGLLQHIDTVVEDQLLAFLAEDRTPAFTEPTYEILDKLTQTWPKPSPKSLNSRRCFGAIPSKKLANVGFNRLNNPKQHFVTRW